MGTCITCDGLGPSNKPPLTELETESLGDKVFAQCHAPGYVAEPEMGPRSKACGLPTFLYRPSSGHLYLKCLAQKWHPLPIILNVLCTVIKPPPCLGPASLLHHGPKDASRADPLRGPGEAWSF